MQKFWNTIRGLFKSTPFNPIMTDEDYVCTHDGSSSCEIHLDKAMQDNIKQGVENKVEDDPRDWGAPHYAGVWWDCAGAKKSNG
jgi:hypothetical protein